MKYEPKEQSLKQIVGRLVVLLIFLTYQFGYLWFIFALPNPVYQLPRGPFPHYDTYPNGIVFLGVLPGLIFTYYDYFIISKRKNRDQRKWYSASNK